MMFTAATASALLAALTLVNAAPTPQSNFLSSGMSIGIKVQLSGFDEASVVDAVLDQTSLAQNNQIGIKEAEVNQAGPWCAGFSDAGATRVIRTPGGDGIFDSVNKAVYGQVVNVRSYWCANTRPEVEAFVARAGANGNGNGNGNQQAPPVNNGGQAPPVNNNGAIVRVELDFGGAEFRQLEFPANVGVQPASAVRGIQRQVDSATPQTGNCQFFSDASGRRALQFPGVIGSFKCFA